MDALTAGSDIATMLTGVSVLSAASVWLWRQWHRWHAANKRRSRLLPGESLQVGQSLYSPDGHTRFTLQPDANMVIKVEGYGVFDDTGTVGAGNPKCLALGEDGWLVLYDDAGRQLWARGPAAARLEVQDNAHVVLYPVSGKAIWATDWLLMRGKPVQHHLEGAR